MDSLSSQSGTRVTLSIPISRPEIFRHQASAAVLALLADDPTQGYGIRELSRAINSPHKSVADAVDDLEAVDLVSTRSEGPKRVVRINPDRLTKPDDPILSIPQHEFHSPVRDLVSELTAELETVHGIIIFGSVARGEADRKSDIDCFVLVENEQARAQQDAHAVVDRLHERRYDGDRHTFQVLVESVDTARDYDDRLQQILLEGLTIHDSPALRALRNEVLSNG